MGEERDAKCRPWPSGRGGVILHAGGRWMGVGDHWGSIVRAYRIGNTSREEG